MAITRTLVELHGGSISASSAGPEEGSTFTGRLPAVQRARRRSLGRDAIRDPQRRCEGTVPDRHTALDAAGKRYCGLRPLVSDERFNCARRRSSVAARSTAAGSPVTTTP